MSTRIHIGDVFEVPLSDGRKALGQYIFRDKMGPIIRIFGQILERDEEVRLSSLDSTSLLFPPVITGLLAAVRSGLWRVIGRLPIDGFQYPNFISAIYNERTGNYGMWYLWDGLISRPIGYELPEDYQSLERLIVWHPLNLVKRIESGDNPYAYPRHGNQAICMINFRADKPIYDEEYIITDRFCCEGLNRLTRALLDGPEAAAD